MRRFFMVAMAVLVAASGMAATAAGAQTSTAIEGTVIDADGAGVAGVAVDLFEADENGARRSYLASTTTGEAGTYRFELEAGGCYSVVFIAPAGSGFATGQYFQTFRCPATDTVARVDAELRPLDGATTVVAEVIDQVGTPQGGVQVDLFVANADGSRGPFLGSGATDGDGRQSFQQPAGCYVTVFIASPGSIFINGSPYWEELVCVEAGESAVVTATLASGANAVYQGTIVDLDGAGVGDAVIDFFTMSGDGTRSTYLFSEITGGDGVYRVELAPGCYITVTIAPEGKEFEPPLGNYYPLAFCLGAGQTFDAVTPPVVGAQQVAFLGGAVVGVPSDLTVEVGLFFSNPNGDRLAPIGQITLPADGDPQGRFLFELVEGCYLVEMVAPQGTRISTGPPVARFSACLGPLEQVDLDPVHLIPVTAQRLDLTGVTGIAHIPGNDRIAVTGDGEVQIWSMSGQLLHRVEGLPQARFPSPVGDTRLVVYAQGTNQLVVIDTADGSIVRRINPGATGVTSVDVVGDVIWYHHGPDQWDAGIGRALVSSGDGVANYYAGYYDGSVIDAAATRPERVYLVAPSLSPSNLFWYDTEGTSLRNPYHDSFWPFAVADDGDVWAFNNEFITQMDPDDLTRTGRAVGWESADGRPIGLSVDDGQIHVATGEMVRSYDRSSLLQTSELSAAGLQIRAFHAAGDVRLAVVDAADLGFEGAPSYFIKDRP